MMKPETKRSCNSPPDDTGRRDDARKTEALRTGRMKKELLQGADKMKTTEMTSG